MVIVIVVVVLAVGLGNRDEGSTPAPSKATGGTSRKKTSEPHGERADLISFQPDDRSAAGITDVWVVWTIKNNSSEKSDYSWDWEAVDANGTRVTNGSELETDVRPGQTARGESITTLNTVKGIRLNITSFDRTASY